MFVREPRHIVRVTVLCTETHDHRFLFGVRPVNIRNLLVRPSLFLMFLKINPGLDSDKHKNQYERRPNDQRNENASEEEVL